MRDMRTSNPHRIWHIPAASSADAGSMPAALPSSRTAVALGAAVVAAAVAPWLVHLAPAGGTPLGPTLLPIFYAPLLAALLLRLPVAIAVSALAPIVSRFLTGMPPEALLPGLAIQIVLFVVALRALRRFDWLFVVPVAYLGSLLVTSAVTALLPAVATVDFAGTLRTGWPGVIVLTMLGFVFQKAVR